MTTIQQLKIHNCTINYHLTYRNQKNLVLRFRDGQIFLSSPPDCPSWTISQFLYKNVAKMLQYQENYQRFKKISLGQEKWILIFNQPVMIELSPIPIHTTLTANKITIYNPGDQAALTKKLYSFLGQRYKRWFWNRTEYWANLLGVEFKNLSLRTMVTKWGICYPQTQKIIYNTKLIHYAPQIIDYVIVHELTHLLHPNHSATFWHAVQRYLPNYADLKAGLRV